MLISPCKVSSKLVANAKTHRVWEVHSLLLLQVRHADGHWIQCEVFSTRILKLRNGGGRGGAWGGGGGVLYDSSSEIEFLDINLTKERLESFAPCYSQSLLLADFNFYSSFNNPYKKSGKQENSTLFMNRPFLERKNEGRNQTKNLESESLRNLN